MVRALEHFLYLENRIEDKYIKGLFDNILTKVLKAYLFQKHSHKEPVSGNTVTNLLGK